MDCVVPPEGSLLQVLGMPCKVLKLSLWPWLSPHPLTLGPLPQPLPILLASSPTPALTPEGSFYTESCPCPSPGHSLPVAFHHPQDKVSAPQPGVEDLRNLTPASLLALISTNSTVHPLPAAS